MTVPPASPPAGAPAGGGRRPRWPRTIRARLTVVLAVPTVLMICLAGAGAAAQLRARADVYAAARHVDLLLSAQDLVHSLQRERGLTAGLVGGEKRFQTDLAVQRRVTDKAWTSLDALLSTPAVRGAPGAAGMRAALGRLAALTATRAAADTGSATGQECFGYFTAAIGAIIDASFSVDVGRSDPALLRGLQSLEALSRAKEATGQERATVTGAFAAGSFSTEEYVRFLETRAAKLAAFDRFQRLATQKEIAALSRVQQDVPATTTATMELKAIAGSRGQQLHLSSRSWYAAITAYIDGLRGVQRAVGDDVRALAAGLTDRATHRLAAFGVLVTALLAGAVVLGVATFRSILRPLRQLIGDANEVAERRLPEAVARVQADDGAEPAQLAFDSPLDSRDDEFAEVAGALRNVHATAVRLAAEQTQLRRNTAESLAHLGHRNQTLLRRQLGFISALEREESDPDALACLFELDHLATRMRRNAESLLVLVGEHGPRRSSEPVAVGDVLRSAVAEVEDYRRVMLCRIDDALVRGAVVAEVAHLVAELVENALAFSPPGAQVEIQGRADAGEYHVAVIDQGVGMSADELTTANARLRGERSFLVAPTRYLGHYVVGRLAERLGVRVWLHESPLSGVTARVVLPEGLLAADQDAAPATTANGLVRRRPRARGRRRAEEFAHCGPAEQAARSPERVRTMLNTFRAGVREGERQAAREREQEDSACP
ncbi:sensor histidine kinase [Nonomuraea sp. NPDC005983]|uniref:sensor histidine kinase n=1 Tax=Nonomuraea sp. NPDC005983 TaxID=3155595 RepID=UPI0033B109D7